MGYVLAIAGQTLTEARRNRVFYSVFLFGLVVVLNSVIFTEVTSTTMDRVLKDTGLAAINLFALALTVFTGVGIVNREIDRKSIYTILAKPISRFGYILGKYLGLLAIILRATSFSLPPRAFVSAFICVAIYVCGHLSGEFLHAVRKAGPLGQAIGRFIYYVIPNLERFNFKYQATYDLMVSERAIATVFVFGLAYVCAALAAAVLVFSRRDFR